IIGLIRHEPNTWVLCTDDILECLKLCFLDVPFEVQPISLGHRYLTSRLSQQTLCSALRADPNWNAIIALHLAKHILFYAVKQNTAELGFLNVRFPMRVPDLLA